MTGASESWLRRFHAHHPGATSAGLARSGSYERLWSCVRGARVLDLACGDHPMPGAIGVDLSHAELVRAGGPVVQARATALPFAGAPVVQARAAALPFAAATFDAAVCHLAFMLFDDPERVVAELARVLAPGAVFHALLGGGPTADGDDAFHALCRVLPPAPLALGDPRARSEAGWRELFAGWHDLVFERWAFDLAGPFEEVWRFLGASYQLAEREHEHARAALRARFPRDPVPCTVVTFHAAARRP